jgi:putative protease
MTHPLPHPPRRLPELLAPAGNPEKLAVAIHYGADAVYMGGSNFGLRNLAGNFTDQELADGVTFAHDRGVRCYLTLNSFPDNADIPSLAGYLERLAPIPFDAYIVSDPGVIRLARHISPERPLHLSTQANTTNRESALFWQEFGFQRVNLAREVTLAGMEDIRRHVTIELEAFVHGALCVAYSGRCLLSAVMSGRHANRGECSHPCRWRYALVEETRPGQYFPIHQEGGGSFIMNSRDLCLLPHLPELVAAGIDSLKIEGRMKGIHYLATVVDVYRQALDQLAADPAAYSCRKEWIDELEKISHRGYTTGFLFGPPDGSDRQIDSSYQRSHDFVGVVEELREDGTLVVAARNRLCSGDELEIMGPGMRREPFHLGTMQPLAADGTVGPAVETSHPNSRVIISTSVAAAAGDLIRRQHPIT